jgi:plastocyanin
VSRFPIVLGSVFVAVSLAGCGGGPTGDDVARVESQSTEVPEVGLADAGGDAASGIVTVLVKRASFEPKEVTVRRGSTVRWVWDGGRHNVVSGTVQDGEGLADGKFCNPGGATCDEAPLKGPPFTYEHAFSATGDFPYFCTPHVPMGMVGVIHVVP